MSKPNLQDLYRQTFRLFDVLLLLMMIVINVRVNAFSTNLQVNDFVVAFDVFFPLVAVLVVVDDDGD